MAPCDTQARFSPEEINQCIARFEAQFPRHFFANPRDALHAPFSTSLHWHAGLPGLPPVTGEAVGETLDALTRQTRQHKGIAYIHVPFCETRCLYCMFYQNPYKEAQGDVYTDALIRELQLWSGRAAQDASPIHAVYFGGGTPTALSPKNLTRILAAVKKYLPLANDYEMTLEGRIHNFTDAKMEAALAGGVNRISLGVQTFDTAIRQSQQRIDPKDVLIDRLTHLCAYDQAAVVYDLIYGFPGQTMQTWQEDLRLTTELPVDGIDCYQLSVFNGSPLARYIAKGKLPEQPDRAGRADMFAQSVAYLSREQWQRLSNKHWGRTTRERNLYNGALGPLTDMLAFGCGAGGNLFGYGFMCRRKFSDWLAAVDEGKKPVDFLSRPAPYRELFSFLGNGIANGRLNLPAMARRFGYPLDEWTRPVTDQWCEAGLMKAVGSWLVLTVPGQFWHATLGSALQQIIEFRLEPQSVASKYLQRMAGETGTPPGAPAGHPRG